MAFTSFILNNSRCTTKSQDLMLEYMHLTNHFTGSNTEVRKFTSMQKKISSELEIVVWLIHLWSNNCKRSRELTRKRQYLIILNVGLISSLDHVLRCAGSIKFMSEIGIAMGVLLCMESVVGLCAGIICMHASSFPSQF
jgi:hypothetical protein